MMWGGDWCAAKFRLGRGCAKTLKGRSRRGFLFFWTPPGSGALGSRRFAAEVWGKSLLTVADASEFSHSLGQVRTFNIVQFGVCSTLP
jgi:hypothetical protein